MAPLLECNSFVAKSSNTQNKECEVWGDVVKYQIVLLIDEEILADNKAADSGTIIQNYCFFPKGTKEKP